MRLAAKFPNFSDVYEGVKLREFVRNLETLFLRVRADITRAAYTVAGNVTLAAYDDVILVDASGGAVTVTLPEISDQMVRDKVEFEVVLVDATNSCTVAPTGADTIVGESSVLIEIQWTALRFRATTGNWVII